MTKKAARKDYKCSPRYQESPSLPSHKRSTNAGGEPNLALGFLAAR